MKGLPRAVAALIASLSGGAWAQAPPSEFKYLPPAQYDHRYEGELTVQIVKDRAGVLKECPASAFPIPNTIPLGCSFRSTNPDRCKIILADDKTIRAAGLDPISAFRHEEAHCNGWGMDHAGARTEKEADDDAERQIAKGIADWFGGKNKRQQ